MSRSPGATQATRMTWDADVLIDLVNDDHGPFDWRAVASELDFPEADFSRAEVCACVCVCWRTPDSTPAKCPRCGVLDRVRVYQIGSA